METSTETVSSSSTSDNSQQGKISIEKIEIISPYHSNPWDITNLASRMGLYESIYSKHTTGDISFIDGRNLIKNLSLTGQEKLRVVLQPFETDEVQRIDRTFRIYKLSNVSKVDDIVQTYNIHFCEQLMFTSKETRLSKTLRGSHKKMLLDVLSTIVESEYGGEGISMESVGTIDNTEGDNHQFLIPNWSVNKTFDWIVNNSNPSENEVGYKNSMFFYQTLTGQYNFKSLDSMLKEQFSEVFTFYPTIGNLTSSASEKNKTILASLKPQEFDTLRGTSVGAYASTLKVYDPIRKIEEINTFDIETLYEKRKEKGEYPLVNYDNKVSDISKKHNSLVINDYTTTHVFSNKKTITDDEEYMGIKSSDNSKLERQALIENLAQNTVEVSLPARTDVSVGQKVKFILQTGEAVINENLLELSADDVYLITGLSLQINVIESNGTLNLECSKESRFKSYDSEQTITQRIERLLGTERTKKK